MSKITVSHDVEERYAELFGDLSEHLGRTKYETLQIMIEAFAALPVTVQDELASKRPGVAAGALEKLAALNGLDLAALGLAQGQDRRDRADRKPGRKSAG